MKPTLDIKSKMTLAYLAILVVILGFFGATAYWILAHNVYRRTHDTLKVSIIEVKVENSSDIAPIVSNDLDYKPCFTYSLGEDQLEKIKSETQSIRPIDSPFGTLSMDQKAYITSDMSGEQEILCYFRPSQANPGTCEIMVITQSADEANDSLVAFSQALLFGIPITILLAGAFGFFLVKRMLRPVGTIVQTAKGMEGRYLNRRIHVQSRDELGELASTLNQTFERLQGAFDQERQFTADASHELRTPLAIMRGEATLALTKERTKEEYQKSLEIISEEIFQMSSIVAKLLTLARSDSGKEHLVFDNVNLKEFLSDLAPDIQVMCEEKTLHFQLDTPESLVVKGDRVKLKELFLNLADNAVHYTDRGGNISVFLTRKGDTANVAIQDTGIGISEDHLPLIFERFYRVNKKHDGGAGLGLAICRNIAEAHGGRIEVKSKVGEGSTFTVILPINDKE